jgi:hypothetical protein
VRSKKTKGEKKQKPASMLEAREGKTIVKRYVYQKYLQKMEASAHSAGTRDLKSPVVTISIKGLDLT